MRLLLYTVAVPVLATCSAATADSYTAPRSFLRYHRREALAQENGALQFGRGEAIPSVDPSVLDALDGSQYGDIQEAGVASATALISFSDGSPLLAVDLPTSTLEEYAGSSICALTSRCRGNGTSGDSREEQPSALAAMFLGIVPEPPSMVMVATGLFGLAGMLRRRRRGSRERR
jgi:hypothetical protein